MRFYHRKACETLAEVPRVCIDHRKARRKRVELGEYVLTTAKHVGCLQNFIECVSTTTKCEENLQWLTRSVLTTAMRVGVLYSFGGCVSTTVKRVGVLERFGECVSTTA